MFYQRGLSLFMEYILLFINMSVRGGGQNKHIQHGKVFISKNEVYDMTSILGYVAEMIPQYHSENMYQSIP